MPSSSTSGFSFLPTGLSLSLCHLPIQTSVSFYNTHSFRSLSARGQEQYSSCLVQAGSPWVLDVVTVSQWLRIQGSDKAGLESPLPCSLAVGLWAGHLTTPRLSLILREVRHGEAQYTESVQQSLPIITINDQYPLDVIFKQTC